MLKEYSKLFQFELFEPEIQLEQFDSDYMLDLYLRDEVKGAEYVYNNIGYFIGRTKFRYISREEVLDKAGDMVLLIDRKIKEQIVKLDIRKNRKDYTAKRLVCYIVQCMFGVLFNMNQKELKGEIILTDEDLFDMPGGQEVSLDEDQELEYMKYKIVYCYDWTPLEREIIIIYLAGYTKKDIMKMYSMSRSESDSLIEKLRKVTLKYLKIDAYYNGTIARQPQDSEDEGDAIGKYDIRKESL